MKSLERQLQNNIAIVSIVVLLILLIITNLSTRSILTDFVSSRLELDSKRILDSLIIQPNTFKVRWRQLNPIYNVPNSGHYYIVQHNDEQLFSPSLKDARIPIINSAEPTIIHDVQGPEEQHLIIWSKTYQKNSQTIVISVAENMNQLMQERKRFTLLFLAVGIIGFILMLFILRLVIRRLFKHLDRSRQEIRQISAGELQQLSEDVPEEIYPLVTEFNRSLSMMQQRMERSRNSLGNLAHALKTPLSLLMQQLENENIEPQKAKKQAERIRQLTERELKRARMAGLGNTTQRFDPREELPTLINVLKQAHQKEQLLINLTIAEEISVFGDREDMLELLGNLLDNAYKWANNQVDILLSSENNMIKIIIEDDGTGIDPAELKSLTQRGTRIDESIEGHGLGLAISKDIVKLYGGTLHFEQAKTLSGLSVCLSLPNH
jgi:signal transduction histidine kinase